MDNSKCLDRFWPKVEKTDSCWLWTASLFTQTGYGQFFFRDKNTTAHKAAFLMLVGPIPEGMQVHHKCHVRACVNPAHLDLVDSQQHGRQHNQNAGKTHCIRGHEFTPENTYVYPEGSYYPGARRCLQCQRDCRRAKAGAR